MREIPKKNYFILLIVVVGFILIVFYLRDWYNAARLYYAETSPILEVSTVINANEISNYALENPNFILYVSSDEDKEIRKFDSELKDLILDNNLTILYVDKKENPNISDTLIEFGNSKVNNKINNNINLYCFKNGKITNVINNVNDYSIKEIEKKLKKNEMIDNA